jgi:hypothetical protein
MFLRRLLPKRQPNRAGQDKASEHNQNTNLSHLTSCPLSSHLLILIIRLLFIA